MTSLSKISKPISGFHGGVSEQPSHVRLGSQHTKIENCYCGVVKGLEKRPGSKFIRDLSLTLNGATDLRAFNFESMGGKYHGYTTNDRNKPLIILDEFGNTQVVSLSDQAKAYMNASTSPESFEVVPVNDMLMIINKEVICQMLPDKSSHDYITLKPEEGQTDGGENETSSFSVTGPASLPITKFSKDYTCPENITRIYAGLSVYSKLYFKPDDSDHMTYFQGQDVQMPVKARVVGTRTTDNITVNGAWTSPVYSNGTWVTLAPNLHIPEGIKSFKVEYEFNDPTNNVSSHNDYKIEGQYRVLNYSGDGQAITVDSRQIGNSLYVNGTIQSAGTVADLPTKGELETMWKEVMSGSEIVYKIQMQSDSNQAAPFYLRSQPGSFHFTESIAPDIEYQLDPATLPILISREGSIFKDIPITWGERAVGDDQTNPTPSFIGKGLQGAIFFKNRLWFILTDGLVGSKALDYFNFWSTSTTSVLDDDPLDVPLNGTQGGRLMYAGLYTEKMLLFSEHQQFSFYSGKEVITPKTAVLSPTLLFDVCHHSNILAMGSSMFFLEPMGNHMNLREMMIQPDVLVEDAANLNMHVPTYVPYKSGTRTKIVGTPASDIIFVYTEAEPNSLYVYQYKWEGNEKAQSAWHKWTFEQYIKDIHLDDHKLYLTTYSGDKKFLEVIHLDEQWELFGINAGKLDRRTDVLPHSYDSVNNQTLFTMPFIDASTDKYIAVDSKTGSRLPGYITGGQYFKADGKHTGTMAVIGIPYKSEVLLSRFTPKPSNGLPLLDPKVTLDEFVVAYDQTAFFKLIIRFGDGQEIVQTYTQPIVERTLLGTVSLNEGILSVKPNLRVEDVQVYIENETHLPMGIIMGEYRGTIRGDYRRM